MMQSLISNYFANVKFNRRLAYLLNCLSCIILLYSLVFYANWFFFRIKQVVISGDLKHTTQEQLHYVLNQESTVNIFSLNIPSFKMQLYQLPWIKDVEVKREFPSTVLVNLTEYTPIARINDEGLLDKTGDVFEAADSNPNLPTFYMSHQSIKLALKRYKQINEILALKQDQVLKLWLQGPQLTTIITKNGVKLFFCQEDLSSDLEHLNRYWPDLLSIKPKLNMINLCYKSGIVIN